MCTQIFKIGISQKGICVISWNFQRVLKGKVNSPKGNMCTLRPGFTTRSLGPDLEAHNASGSNKLSLSNFFLTKTGLM